MASPNKKDGDGDGKYTGASGKDDTPVGGSTATLAKPDASIQSELARLQQQALKPDMTAEEAVKFREDAEALRERVKAMKAKPARPDSDRKAELLKSIGEHRELEDYTDEELNTAVAYSDMQVATGYPEFRDSVDGVKHDRYVFYPDYGGYRPEKETFTSDADATKFEYENGAAVSGPAAPERVFFRKGELPASGVSMNHATQTPEWGVSTYLTPQVGSGIGGGMGGRKWYYGKGRQVGIGSDEEPLIVVTGKWQEYEAPKPLGKRAINNRIDRLLANLK